MANPNRTALLTKMHRVLKQHYTPAAASDGAATAGALAFCAGFGKRAVRCRRKDLHPSVEKFFRLERGSRKHGDRARRGCRVLPDRNGHASNVKRVLQGVFESTYSFDLSL